jgi:aminoglycoside 6'-N-acetyltransferase
VSVGFRPLTLDDLPLLRSWLEREHVKRWWTDPSDEESVAAEYVPAIEGRDPTQHYVIVLGGRPIGMIQTYLLSDHPEDAALIGAGPGVAGVDLLIGEEELTGQGLGVEILRAFTRDVVFAQPGVHACVAGVHPDNRRSLRAFEKAGFSPGIEYVYEGKPERLMRLDRSTVVP